MPIGLPLPLVSDVYGWLQAAAEMFPSCKYVSWCASVHPAHEQEGLDQGLMAGSPNVTAVVEFLMQGSTVQAAVSSLKETHRLAKAHEVPPVDVLPVHPHVYCCNILSATCRVSNTSQRPPQGAASHATAMRVRQARSPLSCTSAVHRSSN